MRESLRFSAVLALKIGIPSQAGGRVQCDIRSRVSKFECGVAGAESSRKRRGDHSSNHREPLSGFVISKNL